MQLLAQLIVQHSQVPRWLMKIDDEHLGRGHAYLDVASLPAIATALQLYAATFSTGTYSQPKIGLCPSQVHRRSGHSCSIWKAQKRADDCQQQ